MFSTIHIHPRANFSLVARYSLNFIRRSLLVVKALVTRLQNSLVTRNRSCSLQKITRYS